LIVFDIDGTILPGTSCERLFVRHLVQQKILKVTQLINFCIRAIELLPQGIPYTTKANKGYLRNFRGDDIAKIGRDFFESDVIARISPKGIERIKKHVQDGEKVILFSGMPDFLLRNFSNYLDIPDYYGSIMEIQSGRFTGKTLGPFPLAKGKIEALEMIIAGAYSADVIKSAEPAISRNTAPVNWSQITFYGDHWLDRFLMQKVGHSVAVNPREKLRALAEEKGWPIEEFGVG
jgi:putative phosphoserine phosphatase / 1-acylglycerol-3-phosphate O-acyltransferase